MITRMLGITAMIALNSLAHSHAPFPSTTPKDHASHTTQAKKKNKLTSSSHTKAEDVETIHEGSSKKKL